MSITQKYNFKVSINQFQQPVSEHWWDASEQLLIDFFEKTCLELKNLNKTNYTMIELGSNQCYYSLLFKHILGKNITTNIMVEPFKTHYDVGQKQFELNNCTGIFYNNSIGTSWENFRSTFDVEPITLNEILKEQDISEVDIIQCDIDGSEHYMLDINSDFFINKKAKYLFLGTHSTELHNNCKQMLEQYGYNILLDHPHLNVGFDMLIVAQS